MWGQPPKSPLDSRWRPDDEHWAKVARETDTDSNFKSLGFVSDGDLDSLSKLIPHHMGSYCSFFLFLNTLMHLFLMIPLLPAVSATSISVVWTRSFKIMTPLRDLGDGVWTRYAFERPSPEVWGCCATRPSPFSLRKVRPSSPLRNLPAGIFPPLLSLPWCTVKFSIKTTNWS